MPIILCYQREAQVEGERKKTAKMLYGLHGNSSQQRSESAELKRLERAKRGKEKAEILTKIEKEQTEEEQFETLACAGDVSNGLERGRVLGASGEHMACICAMIKRAGPEKQSPDLMEALEGIKGRILEKM